MPDGAEVTSSAVPFYIAIGFGTYSKGFRVTVMVKNQDGQFGTIVKTFSNDVALSIERNTIFSMNPISLNPEDYYYSNMWIVNTEESEDDYVLGFYAPLKKGTDGQYTGQYYAPGANTKIAFVPEQSLDGPYFGLKDGSLVNKKSEVTPVVISEAGYYNISIDTKAKTYSVVSYTPEAAKSEALSGKTFYLCGTGIDGNDWTMVESLVLSPEGSFRLTGTIVCDSEWPTFVITSSDWATQFRPNYIDAAYTICDGWLIAGSGNTCWFHATTLGNYPATFDNGVDPAWVTVKVPQD